MANSRVHLMVKGRVQGVFFRYETQKTAQGLGLSGWVRNRKDGSVEILAEGPKDRLEKLIVWCRQGPPSAQVENVETSWEQPTGEYYAFNIERSA